eukprot:TRINITY_DN3179_c0_g2_i1.p1 TRINITY_DN3179_c0_g2~~TRINITY_DN3179_c0_g2_i1.p1  ORF type:complete len:898 (-),score=207.24 TRINITY_DN3179_c0_g2_i1:111-2804(-)
MAASAVAPPGESSSLALLPFRWTCILIVIFLQILLLTWFVFAAYEIRMYPIKDFGYTIHEFDPWFNYRATEYLAEHGLSKFNKWYDYESWYPIGRPIGTTIYPGMQITGVFIWDLMKAMPEFKIEVPSAIRELLLPIRKRLSAKGAKFLPPIPKTIEFTRMDVNQICCMIPCWFGSIASIFCGLLAHEVSRSVNAGLMTVGVMSILPAHLMRSVGGKFDNECVAMAAICSTFWLWLRSVRNPSSWLWGALAGLSYVYMVAAWGGYIFVLNMIGIHALLLVGLGRFNSGVHKAYSLFYIIGTYGAMQIPVVGWTPLRSLEQLGPLGVFLGYQVLAFCDYHRRKQAMETARFIQFRIKCFGVLIVALMVAIILLYPTGYFGPLSSRIRGLFVKHTKTGNPLVDSVAEHQPASAGIYQSYLHLPLSYWPFGAAVCLFKRNNGVYFLALYGFVATHFSGKMSRLVLICAPICSVVCGIWLGWVLDSMLQPFLLLLGKKPGTPLRAVGNGKEAAPAETEAPTSGSGKKGDKKAAAAEAAKKKAPKKKAAAAEQTPLEEWDEDVRPGGMAQLKRHAKQMLWESVPEEHRETFVDYRSKYDRNFEWVVGRAGVAVLTLVFFTFASAFLVNWTSFVNHCDSVALSMSTAQVKFKVQGRDGGHMIIDDHYKGYKWIDENTPKDSRVMAWWDYGYQITGIARRTSIADGNTWNHEHIATLGRILTSSQKRAHNSIRHLADYVLVWAGGRSDDLAKSPHLARIGNSVFPDHCGDDDPRCHKFGFINHDQNNPTPMMRKSLLYNMVKHNLAPNVKVDPKLFKEVHSTKHGLLRVFQVLNVSQESKDWIADPKNRICDAPGSWYCVGQYPPALDKLIEQRKSFSQVEDFNKKGEKSAYTKLIEKEAGREL